MWPDRAARLVVLTRPAGQDEAERGALEAIGVATLSLPAIVIEPRADAAALARLETRLDTFDLVHFASRNAVEQLIAAAPGWPRRTPRAGQRIAFMGAGTRAALERLWPSSRHAWFGLGRVAAVDSETLLAALEAERTPLGRVLLVKGEGGRHWLADTIAARGGVVEPVVVYRRLAPSPEASALATLGRAVAAGVAPEVVVSSSEAAFNLTALLEGAGAAVAGFRGWPVYASHPRITDVLQRLDWRRTVAVAPGVEALVQRLKSPPGP